MHPALQRIVVSTMSDRGWAATGKLLVAIAILIVVIVVVAILPLLPGIHPRMVSDFRGPEPTRLLEPPGFLAANYGRMTPVVTIIAHAIYGAIIGAFYMV